MSFLTNLFQKENFAIPNGFSNDDVNMDAPRLYTDTFCLAYINHMSKAGMTGYSAMLSLSVRTDLLDYFTKELINTSSLFNRSTELMLEKAHWFVRLSLKSLQKTIT